MIHPGWEPTLDAWRLAGLARDLDRAALAPLLLAPPSPRGLAQVLAAHYHAAGDVVERAWRSQHDRFLELPEEPLAPEILASAVHVILPEARVGVLRHPDAIELRLATDERALATTGARVMLRSVSTHARRGVVRRGRAAESIPARSFVYAINAMLETRGAPVRFLPLVSLPDRRAWIATTLERALILEDADSIATHERWRDFCRYNDVVLAA